MEVIGCQSFVIFFSKFFLPVLQYPFVMVTLGAHVGKWTKSQRTKSRKIWPLRQNPRVLFQGSGQNPRHFLYLLFIDVILLNLWVLHFTFIIHGIYAI